MFKYGGLSAIGIYQIFINKSGSIRTSVRKLTVFKSYSSFFFYIFYVEEKVNFISLF